MSGRYLGFGFELKAVGDFGPKDLNLIEQRPRSEYWESAEALIICFKIILNVLT